MVRQKAMLSTSLRAAARWMRNGNNTASVETASDAVHDHGAAASWAVSPREGDRVILGIWEGELDRRPN